MKLGCPAPSQRGKTPEVRKRLKECETGSGPHRDGEGIAVRDLVVYYGLDVYGLQLEADGDVDKPERGGGRRGGGGGGERGGVGDACGTEIKASSPSDTAIWAVKQHTASIARQRTHLWNFRVKFL